MSAQPSPASVKGPGPLAKASRPSYSSAHKSRKSSQANIVTQASPVSTSNGVNRSIITVDQPGAQKDALIYLLVALVGSIVTVTCKSQTTKLQGILSSAQTDGDLGIVLKRVKTLTEDGHASSIPLQDVLIVYGRDIVDIAATDVNLADRTAPVVQGQKGPDTFRTDTEITGVADMQEGRQLTRWADEMDNVSPATQTFSSNNTAWDQFAVNERLFGSKTNYDEEIYTTKLDRSAADFKEREKRAAVLANQILSSTTDNTHIAEERGHAVTDGLDEEDKYSGVIRSANAYVPPAFRKALAQAVSANTNPSTLGPALARLPSNRGDGKAFAAPPTESNNDQLLGSFKSFVTEEKKRLEPKRATAVTRAKDSRIAELKSFAANFKLNTPPPADLVPLLAKDEKKQQEILTSKPASLGTIDPLVPPATGSISMHTTPQLQEAKLASRVAKQQPSGKPSIVLPQIPSFAQLQALKVTKAGVEPGPTEAPPAILAAPSKISALAKEFRPNPNASVFKPGGNTALAPTPTPTVQPPQQVVHPFFGTKPIQHANLMHVKEDFSPFVNGQAPDPASIASTWSFTGPSYKIAFGRAASPVPVAQPVETRSQEGMSATPVASAGTGPFPMPQAPMLPNMPMRPGNQAMSSPYQMFFQPNAFRYPYPGQMVPQLQPGQPLPSGFMSPPFPPGPSGYPHGAQTRLSSRIIVSAQVSNLNAANFATTPGMFPAINRHSSASSPPPQMQGVPSQVYYHSPSSPQTAQRRMPIQGLDQALARKASTPGPNLAPSAAQAGVQPSTNVAQ